jgi:glycogen debranching enzyme
VPDVSLPSEYAVVARGSRPGPLPFVLKDGETFAVFNALGDIRRDDGGDLGIFFEGSRHLSRFELFLWGQRPILLSSTVREDNCLLVADLTNPDVPAAGVPRGIVHIRRTSVLGPAAFHHQLAITSFAQRPFTVPFTLRFEADFHDIFEERGMVRPRRGRTRRQVVGGHVRLSEQGLDGRERSSSISLDGATTGIAADALAGELFVAARQATRICCCVWFSGSDTREGHLPADGPHGDTTSGSPCEHFDAAVQRTVDRFHTARQSAAVIHTSNAQFNQWLHRSFSDIHLLATPSCSGLYPYAGIPWFTAAFGRDGIITARESLTVEPQLARGVLGYLARNQATLHDPATDAEPGKILHESRLGEMAALGEIPFGRYYGSIDATPLFVMLAGDYLTRTGDLPFLAEIWPQIEAAMTWMRSCGDRDGDGFIEYLRAADTGLRNQGWKDSEDSVSHGDGRLAEGPVALCEVQAYAYAAGRAAGKIAAALGRREQANRFDLDARRLKGRFTEGFWSPELGSYALALDGSKRPCLVRSSNAGHCLLSGIARPEHAATLAHTLLAASSFNGFGVRTLDDREARYNPMSYHNGSVWPHDNALVALGLARYGFKAEALRIMTGLFEASTFMPMHRLPELFCGFARQIDEGPTLYPVACMPQAWASAAVFALLEAVTGLSLSLDATTGRPTVRLTRPVLPPSLERIRITGLRVGEDEVDLDLHRYENDVGVQTTRRSPSVDVVIEK